MKKVVTSNTSQARTRTCTADDDDDDEVVVAVAPRKVTLEVGMPMVAAVAETIAAWLEGGIWRGKQR